MDRRRMIGGAVLLIIGGLFVFVRLRREKGRSDEHPAHREDSRLGPLQAMEAAPEGTTPCETVYNAYKAYDDAAREQDVKVPYAILPSRDTMIARCLALSPEMQLCMQPRYAKANRATCTATLAPIYRDKFNPLLGKPNAAASASTSAPAASSP